MANIAFITGAASGIGFATAQRLHQRGWKLGLADWDIERLQQVSAQWDQQRVQCYQLDVRNAQQVTHVLDEFAQQHQGQLHLLFNSAGILQIDAFTDISSERHQQIVDINLMGTIHCCQAAFPYLQQTDFAQVINMSSASATYGIPNMAVYSASKFAVQGLTEALNIEWQPFGIRVTDIMPPFVNTTMLTEQKNTPAILQRMGTHISAEQVADSVMAQLEIPRLHRTVGWRFTLTHRLSDWLPRFVTGWSIRWLNRPL